MLAPFLSGEPSPGFHTKARLVPAAVALSVAGWPSVIGPLLPAAELGGVLDGDNHLVGRAGQAVAIGHGQREGERRRCARRREGGWAAPSRCSKSRPDRPSAASRSSAAYGRQDRCWRRR